jgi:hypothetical protein
MHELEERIRGWRRQWVAKLSRAQLDELEAHLREELDHTLAPALDAAWADSVASLGDPNVLAAEFAKVRPDSGWLPARLVSALACGVTLLLLALFGLAMLRRGDPLLSAHVVLVTLGYLTTFLIGALGVCFALMRPFAEWHTVRSRSLRRVAAPLTVFGGGCTLAGMLLGMRWAAQEWGVAWSWDSRETGALAVVVGNGALAVLLMLPRVADSARMALALLNSVLVSLAWFHPLLGLGWGTRHSDGIPTWAYPALLGALVAQAGLVLLAVTPERWLRRRATE